MEALISRVTVSEERLERSGGNWRQLETHLMGV